MFRQDEIKPMLTVKDVARLLHIHTNTVRRWSDQNIIKAYRITRRGDRRFRREDIAHYLSESAAGRFAGVPDAKMEVAKPPGEKTRLRRRTGSIDSLQHHESRQHAVRNRPRRRFLHVPRVVHYTLER